MTQGECADRQCLLTEDKCRWVGADIPLDSAVVSPRSPLLTAADLPPVSCPLSAAAQHDTDNPLASQGLKSSINPSVTCQCISDTGINLQI